MDTETLLETIRYMSTRVTEAEAAAQMLHHENLTLKAKLETPESQEEEHGIGVPLKDDEEAA